MKLKLTSCLLCSLGFFAQLHAAKEILLQHAPDADAPVIAKITATEKVILDAAPADRNATLGWRQLALPTPFEGYVPIATLDKSMAIVEGTPVHYLPSASSAEITTVEPEDRYEIVRAGDEWATVRFYKEITGYFLSVEEAPALDLSFSTTPVLPVAVEPSPKPVAIPAPPKRINPDEPIAQVDPATLPPENVIWRAASPAMQDAAPAPSTQESESPSEEADSGINDLVVSPSNTQAREVAPQLGPAKTPRLLTGVLIREIAAEGPTYPIRLRSPEGRLIAYVDFSGVFISDLSPYIGQKVYLRGQVYPLPANSSQLVILAQEIRLAE